MSNTRGIVPKKITGFRDINPDLNALRWQIVNNATQVYKSFGFEHWDTPVLEYADCMGKYLPDRDTIDQGVFSFRSPEKEPIYNSTGEELRDDWNRVLMENHFLALRYDLTAPLSRFYAELLWKDVLKSKGGEIKTPLFRRYQYGPVFRFEKKIEPGRFREFWQLDFDSVGTKDVSADAEICMVLSAAFEKIGLERGTYIIKVNNRKILNGFLFSLGITDEDQIADVLRVIDKFDKIGFPGVKEELGAGRVDASGSMIKGLDIPRNAIDNIIDFLQDFHKNISRKDTINRLKSYSKNQTIEEGILELESIDNILSGLEIYEDRVIFDPSFARGLAYYTGPVFEVESLITYIDDKGNKRNFGAIAAGGRYDGLVQSLLGVKVPATGASIGVDRLAELLTKVNKNTEKEKGAVLVAHFDDALIPEYQKIAMELRNAGVDTEVFYGDQRQLKKQLQYADKKQSPIAIILGENEFRKGVVSVRNLELGKELSATIVDKAEWKNRVQFEVERKDVVKTVLEILNKK